MIIAARIVAADTRIPGIRIKKICVRPLLLDLSEAMKRIFELLKFIELEARRDSKINALSTGPGEA